MINYMTIPGKQTDKKTKIVENYYEMLSNGDFKQLEIIRNIVEEYFMLGRGSIAKKTRKWPFSHAKQLAIYLARKYTRHSLYNIGRFLRNVNHATSIHSLNTIESEMDYDERVRQEVYHLGRKIRIVFDDFIDGEYKIRVDRDHKEVSVNMGIDFNMETFKKIHEDLKDKGIDSEFKVYIR